MSPRRLGRISLLFTISATVTACSIHIPPRAADSAGSSPGVHAQAVSTVTVDGIRIPAVRARTVAAALTLAGIRPSAGHLLAVSSHRVLGSDHTTERVLIDGHPASLAAALAPGAAVTATPGPDRIEPTRIRVVNIPAPNPSNLYLGGRPGKARALVGLISGEILIQRILVSPQIGRLQSPGAVALTFDDGPDPTWTLRVLALLAAAHVHATFCLIGRQVPRYPDVVRRIAAAGDALCDHTWDHDEQLRSRPAGLIALDIARAARAIEKYAGAPATFFRAPGGNWSPAVEAEARRQHMTPLKWTVDPRDWSRPGTASILDTVYRQLRPGGVILLHDGGGDRSQTLAALKIMLTRLPAMGYHFVLPVSGAGAR